MSATANTNGGAAACPQARRMQDGLHGRRRQRRLMGHKLPLLYYLPTAVYKRACRMTLAALLRTVARNIFQLIVASFALHTFWTNLC